MEHHGYWFYDLQANKIIQAKDLLEEYCLLNCPQSVHGPFKDKIDVEKYVEKHPNLSEKFNKDLQEYWEYCNQEINSNQDNYIYQDELC